MTQLVIQHYAKPTARRHLWIGMAMAVVAIAFGIDQATQWLAAHPMAAKGLEASLLAGAATGLGAIPVLMLRRPSERLMAPMLGLAGGMMLAASLFSLLVPAVQIVAASDAAWWLGIATAMAFMAGVAAMHSLDRRMPHEHVETVESRGMTPNVALVVAAIAIHNVPEGLAVGVAAAAGAMLWVVSHEMIPASHRPGRVGSGTAGLAAGFAVMTVLAAAF